METHLCAVCNKSFAVRNLVPGGAVRDTLAEEISKDFPQWSANSFICHADIMRYRTNYVHAQLQSEKGDLTKLEQEVLDSMRDHELLTRNVDAELEQTWTFGERLADHIAVFGGRKRNWKFATCMTKWITCCRTNGIAWRAFRKSRLICCQKWVSGDKRRLSFSCCQRVCVHSPSAIFCAAE